MSDKELFETYVPDVYQESILGIQYEQLLDAGIKLITFDMDETIAAYWVQDLSKKVITLFERLKNSGLLPMLVTNNSGTKVGRFAQKLDIDFVMDAHKPRGYCFDHAKRKYYDKYGVEITKEQMAHVGNSIINDVGGAKTYGIISCLVRNSAPSGKALIPAGLRPGVELRKVLLERKIWRKHHKYAKGDQYYQLNDTYKHQAW